jgi:hypothetical protein
MANSYLESNWVNEGQLIVEKLVKSWSDRYLSIVKYRERNYTDFM